MYVAAAAAASIFNFWSFNFAVPLGPTKTTTVFNNLDENYRVKSTDHYASNLPTALS